MYTTLFIVLRRSAMIFNSLLNYLVANLKVASMLGSLGSPLIVI